ncbi:hypothetical protein [Bradyrhizobium oligotrophicum]|uniref:hypothetical protein n=1 Tax=Bradyrhizobium oligotrophicum TaxID=44255 RepID=UPI003EC0369B
MARTPKASKSRTQKPTKRPAKSAAKAKRRVTRIVPSKRKRRTSSIDFDLPTDPNQQLIAGAIFSESTAGANANADEKRCIGLCIVNMAYYATLTQDSGKPCYNSSFGDGSILSAIKKNIYGYGSAQWKKVMDADAMKSKDDLEDSLTASEVKHLKGSVEASATAIAATAPASDSASGRIPVQFNQAANNPPSTREEKIARYASETFYAFKTGRECQ